MKYNQLNIGPAFYYPDELERLEVSVEVSQPNKGKVWVKARPLSCSNNASFLHRLKMAWEVFRGKSDVLRWRGQ